MYNMTKFQAGALFTSQVIGCQVQAIGKSIRSLSVMNLMCCFFLRCMQSCLTPLVVVLGSMLDTTVLSSNQTGSKVFTFTCQPRDTGCILGPDSTGDRVAGIVLHVVLYI